MQNLIRTNQSSYNNSDSNVNCYIEHVPGSEISRGQPGINNSVSYIMIAASTTASGAVTLISSDTSHFITRIDSTHKLNVGTLHH